MADRKTTPSLPFTLIKTVMGYFARAANRLGGRRLLISVGLLYILGALSFPITPPAGNMPPKDIGLTSALTGISGIVLSYGGYRLAQTEIRPDLYHVVAVWCLRAIAVMASIILSLALITQITTLYVNLAILTGLAGIAGLGMGYHDGKAQTRAVNAEEYSRELEQANRQLRQYGTIVETVNDGIFVADEDNHFTLVNDAYCEMVGYDREELLGEHTSLVVNADSEDAAAIIDEVEHDLKTGTTETKRYETPLKTASGDTIEVEWSVAPIPNEDSDDSNRVVVVRDVTERNERERQLERQNDQLDSFASLLAHELRNPVNIGQIYSQQLPEEEDNSAVEYIREAFDRIEDMIDIMLIVTRGREAVSESTPVELARVAKEAWEGVDAPDAILEVTTTQTIDVDETYIHHLLWNLFENAVQHGGEDVTVTVGDLPSGFFVADDGVGIPADRRERIFETGYTTASDTGGMGLGLTFVSEMADVYDWECSVRESDEGGVRFDFENMTKSPRVIE